MSYSLHHGYRIRTDSPATLTNTIEGFRERAMDLAKELIAERLAEKAVEMIDDAKASGGPMLSSPVFLAYSEMQEAFKASKRTGRRNPQDDFECEANFIVTPAGDPVLQGREEVTRHDGAVYVLLHAEMNGYHDLFLSMPGVEEYRCALDCSEPQWGIAADEWERRSVDWQAVLKDRQLGPLGLHFELLGHSLPSFDHNQVLAKLPDLGTRLERLACNAAWLDFCPAGADSKRMDIRQLTRLCFAFDDWIKSDDGQAALMARADRLRQVIKPNLDLFDLFDFKSAVTLARLDHQRTRGP